MMDDDGGFIADAVPINNLLDSAPDYFPMEVDPRTDDTITFSVEPFVFLVVLRLWNL